MAMSIQTPPKICCQILQKAAEQVWSYFILRTTWLEYAGTTMNPQFVFRIHKKFLPKQINLQNFLTQKYLGIKNFKP